MGTQYKSLFTPWKIGNLEMKNRIVLCPMGGTCIFGWMEKNHFDKEAAELLLEIAKNETGLVIPGIAPVRDVMYGHWLYKSKGKFKQLKKYMEEFHKTGAKMFIQLTAGFGRSFAIPESMRKLATNKFLGALAKPIMDMSYTRAAPSELPSRWDETISCRPLTQKEIKQIIYAFGQTSKLCKEAGVDGIEVHAVHEGYLLDQFTTEYTNKRTDEYGGSFENRYRFPVDIVKEIKKECGQDFPVSLRYSVVSKTKAFDYGAMPGEDFVEAGRNMKESEKAAKYLQDAGYDMLDCDNGTYDAWYWAHPPAYMPSNCNLEDVEHIKKFVDIPVVCAGRMTPDVADKAIEENAIDAMGVGRQYLVDPTWATKLKNGKEEDIQPCILCHNACFNMAHYKGVANVQDYDDTMHMCRCALNPQTMNEGRFKIVPTKKPKKIAVIGGGVGGMETARIATLRGHKVTIYEKTNKLGGVFVPASNFDFKEHDQALLKWYINQVKKLKIPVKFNTEITDVSKLDADEIVVATGAKPRILRFDGSDKAIDAIDYLNGVPVGDRVLILGGGLTGCEIAYDLHRKGKTPIIVEIKNDLIAVKGVCLANSSFLRDYFKTNKVEVHLESSVVKFENGVVHILDRDGKETKVKADSLIMSVGYIPAPVFQKDKHIHIVGDASHVGNLRTVVWRAWEVAEEI
jgi:2-enoate reductase